MKKKEAKSPILSFGLEPKNDRIKTINPIKKNMITYILNITQYIDLPFYLLNNDHKQF